MGTIVASDLLGKAQTILVDTTGLQWNPLELLGWLSDGQREVLIYKPNAYVVSKSVRLVAGTKQTLPADAVQLIDVTRNMGADGETPGRVIRITMREVLDASLPNWHNARASAECRHYMYNPLDPKRFYCYPPQPVAGQGYVEMVYGGTPPDLEQLSDAIKLDDIYQNPLIDYVLYRAYSKQTDGGDVGLAASHYGAFTASLTGKTQGESIVNPNTAAPASPSA